jgi:hypothetical protein
MIRNGRKSVARAADNVVDYLRCLSVCVLYSCLTC